MSARERAKGKRGELEAIALIRWSGWPDAHRTSDGRGQSGRGDVAGGPAGCHIEIKRHERLNVPEALAQVRADCDRLDIPILVHRPSRSEWMATLPLTSCFRCSSCRESA